MTLVVIHYHLRPGGIRRVIELAVPHLVRHAPRPITRVVLAAGDAPNAAWKVNLAAQLSGVPLQVVVEPALRYLSEQRATAASIRFKIHRCLQHLLANASADDTLVWAHNLGVSRNILLAKGLADFCFRHGLPLVSHHHDWWFDNRWVRWPEMRSFGVRTLKAAAQAIFPGGSNVFHAAINHADAAILKRHFGEHAFWIPNLTEPTLVTNEAAARRARVWLNQKLGTKAAPVWLLPCRTLRRKNIAEALLLTRWLRPEGWLVVTGGPSSADEVPYFRALDQAARRAGWPLLLGALAGDESGKPGVPELIAASEAVLLTSVQEGFGLAYLEASAAGRPLIARRLPNIAPDLQRFGFRFPQLYDEILIPPDFFDWTSELARQRRSFAKWRACLPRVINPELAMPAMLCAGSSCPIPFSRLTLTAQLEVLSHPAHVTWPACARLNPFLQVWRKRATNQKLKITSWPRSASRWLGGEAYARRIFDGLRSAAVRAGSSAAFRAQTDFIGTKLDSSNLYPLLWTSSL